MAFYALLSFLVFLYRTEMKRKAFYVMQVVLILGIQTFLFMQMVLKMRDMRYLFFFAFQAVMLVATILLYKLLYPDANLLIINNMCLMLMVSMAILTRLSGNKAIRQFIIAVASLLVALVIPAIVHRFRFGNSIWWIFGVTGLAALTFVLILGRAINGSNLNYSVGGVTFQPSEFIKIVFVFFVASGLVWAKEYWQLFTVAAVAALHVLILMLSRDLGAGLIYFVAFFLMLYIARDHAEWLFVGAVSLALASAAGYRLFSHVRSRVQVFLDPWEAIDGAGYQVAQSLFGVSVGGPFGLGLYGGTPSAIPFVEQDFVFSALAEELGIVFAVSLLLVCLSTFFMILWIAGRVRDPYYRLLCAGFGVMYVFQVFLTVGGGVKFIPLTGVTLPLVSYGGSSVLATILMFGLLEGIVLIRADEHRAAVERLRGAADRGSAKKSRGGKRSSGEHSRQAGDTKSRYDDRYEDDEEYEDEIDDDE